MNMSKIKKSEVVEKITELKEKLDETKKKPLPEFEFPCDDDIFFDGFRGTPHTSIIHPRPWKPEERKRYAISGLEENIAILEDILLRDLQVSEVEIAKKKEEILRLEKDIRLIEKALPILKEKKEKKKETV
jgi:hypothetical protein